MICTASLLQEDMDLLIECLLDPDLFIFLILVLRWFPNDTSEFRRTAERVSGSLFNEALEILL